MRRKLDMHFVAHHCPLLVSSWQVSWISSQRSGVYVTQKAGSVMFMTSVCGFVLKGTLGRRWKARWRLILSLSACGSRTKCYFWNKVIVCSTGEMCGKHLSGMQWYASFFSSSIHNCTADGDTKKLGQALQLLWHAIVPSNTIIS